MPTDAPDGGAPELPASGRLIGVDLGAVRIGIAVSDSAQRIALPHEVIVRSGDLVGDRQSLAAIVEEFGARGVVVGLPLSLSGELGSAALSALKEVDALSRLLEVPVVTVDERLSTVEATRRRQDSGSRGKGKRRRAVDDGAAAVLLQAYLDRRIAESRQHSS